MVIDLILPESAWNERKSDWTLSPYPRKGERGQYNRLNPKYAKRRRGRPEGR